MRTAILVRLMIASLKYIWSMLVSVSEMLFSNKIWRKRGLMIEFVYRLSMESIILNSSMGFLKSILVCCF